MQTIGLASWNLYCLLRKEYEFQDVEGFLKIRKKVTPIDHRER